MVMHKVITQAAELISNAKRALFLTSAGMSADSNIPTFRDKDATGKTSPLLEKKIFKHRIWQAHGPSAMSCHTHGPFMNGGDKMPTKTYRMKAMRSSING